MADGRVDATIDGGHRGLPRRDRNGPIKGKIEDRARRVDGGTLHAGFQRLSNLKAERALYADLADGGLDVA